MGLRLKFNLVLLAVFLAGFGVAGYISTNCSTVMPASRCWARRGW